MNFLNFEGKSSKYDVAILIKDSSLKKREIEQYYINPLVLKGFKRNRIIAIGLAYGNGNKVSKKQIKDHLEYILPNLKLLQVKYVMCADANYYKELANQRKADTNLDKMVVGKYDPDMLIGYSLNYSSLMYNPAQGDKITLSIDTLVTTANGGSTNITIPFTEQRYPLTVDEIADELDYLLQFEELAVDIETFGLKLGSGIASIAFSESSTSGASFLVDYRPNEQGKIFGYRKDNLKVRSLLKKFFKSYKGVSIYHRSAFDVKHLIWELFMDHPLDFKGMLEGVRTLGKNFADTLFMAFLTLNSTTRPNLGLKSLGYEFAGDYGEEEIKDVRKIQWQQLLKYNLSDTCTTFWVMEKYWDAMVQEDQESVYWEFIKMQRVLFRTELHGMPMNDQRLTEVENILIDKRNKFAELILNSDEVIDAEYHIISQKVKKDNKKLKTKVRTMDDYEDFVFNPGSDQQLRVLLHNVMQLPVVKVTPTKEPKTDADTINILIHKTDNPKYKELLQTIIDYSEVCTVINTFIKAFKEGMLKADGRRYLHGDFNLAKVKSGRLSSSNPNLQNLK
jgi:DNA polymerase I